MESKNIKTLAGFVEYCYEHPELRFWQALCNWATVSRVLVQPDFREPAMTLDTYNWEERLWK